MTIFNVELTWLIGLEYGGTLLSIMGAELISRKIKISAWGWACWMLSNVLLAFMFYTTKNWGLMVLQLWFMKTSFAGIRNYLWPTLGKDFLKIRKERSA